MATSRRDRRRRGQQQKIRLVLGAAAALLAALLVYQLTMQSDGGPKTAAGPVPAVSSHVADTSTTTVPQEPSLPNGSFSELSLRDPFQPVGQVSTGTTATSTTTTTTPSTGSISTTPTTSPSQNPAGAQEISVLDVYSNNGVVTARVQVGGQEFTVAAGQNFATNYRLVQFTSDKCADFEHGSTTFNLCAGEQSNK